MGNKMFLDKDKDQETPLSIGFAMGKLIVIEYAMRTTQWPSCAEIYSSLHSFVHPPMYKCFDEIPIPLFFISSHSFTLFTLYCVDIGPYRMLEIDP